MRRILSLLALALLSVAPAHAAGGSVRSVLLTRFVGVPADSSARQVFMDAFRAELDAEVWACEKRAGDAWVAAESRTNFFRLVDAAPADQAWSLELSIRLPPEVRVRRKAPPGSKLPPPRARVSQVRSSRGLIIAATAVEPRIESGGKVAAEPVLFAVYFADARRVVVPSPRLPAGGYAYPWADAGRVVARAALEALHRANGGLARDERAALAPATRVEAAGADATP